MCLHPLTFLLALALTGAQPTPPDAPAVGKPCLFTTYFAEWRSFPAIIRDRAGDLRCGTNLLNDGGQTPAPPAAGDPSATAMVARDERQPRYYFTYRDADGGVQALWFTRIREHDEWHHLRLTRGGATQAPEAAGDPSGLDVDEVYHATYRDREGGIVDLARPDGWTVTRLNGTGATTAPPAAGDPVQVFHRGVRHVVYRDLQGGLQDLTCEDGQWRAQCLNLGGALSAPAALGQPALLADAAGLHVVYRDAAGNVRDLVHDGAWQARRVNRGGLTQAAEAAGDPAAASVKGALHVTYRDLRGRLEDVWSDGAWHHQVLNLGAATDAPAAAGDPSTLVPPSLWFLVSYVDVQGQAQLLTFQPDKGWTAGPLTQALDRAPR